MVEGVNWKWFLLWKLKSNWKKERKWYWRTTLQN